MVTIRYLIPVAKNPHDFAGGMDTPANQGNVPMLELLLRPPLANVNGKWSGDTPLFGAGLPHHYEKVDFFLRTVLIPKIALRGALMAA